MATYMNQTNSGRIIVQQTSPSAIIVQPDNEHKIILKGSGGLKGETGEQGPAGEAATIAVGTTSTLAPGASATVTNSGTSSAAVLDFGIPKGEKGDTGATGPANTLSIGTVQKGDTAEATITGTAPNQTLNLTLPKGDKGDTGAQGPAGEGVVAGGTTGQVLTKKSGTDYDTEWATPTTYSDFTGASSSVAGTHGLVPAPTTSDPDKFLKGDGTWGTPPGATYTGGTGIDITGNVVSVDNTVAMKSDLPTDTADLTNGAGYITASDYATNAVGGTVKITGAFGLDMSNSGELKSAVVSTSDYPSMWNDAVVSKGTLENALSTKNYATQADIPTVNDATLTIQKNGTTVETFTANSSTNKTANIAVPTKTSDLTNDGADGTSTYVEADELAPGYITGEGTDIALSNTQGSRFSDVKFKGDTEQTTYSGKNLFNLVTPATQSGITVTANADGSFTVNGTTTGVAAFTFELPTPQPAGTYTISCTSKNQVMDYAGFFIRARNVNQAMLVNGESQLRGNGSYYGAKTFTSTDQMYYVALNLTATGVTYNNMVIYPQIEKASTATAFEPYVGGAPSPSPSYPQAVQTATGEQTIAITGKNLCNGISQGYWLNAAANNAGVTSNDSGLIIPVSQNTDYTISTTATQTRYRIAFSDQVWSGSQFTCYNGQSSDNTSVSITKNSGTHKYLIVNATDLTKIQVEKGSAATTYESYHGQTYKINLGKNLLNTAVLQTGFINDSGVLQYNTQSLTSAYIEVLPNTTYTASADATYRVIGAAEFTAGKTFIKRGESIGISSYSLTTTGSTKYIRVYYNKSEHMDITAQTLLDDKAQIEKGSTRTDYNVYADQIELCKIGDYQDYIYKSNDTWYLHKMTASQTIDTSTITLRSTYTNIEYAVIPKPSSYLYVNTFEPSIDNILCSHASTSDTASWDTSGNIGKIYGNAQAMYFWIGFAKGTGLDAIKATLNGAMLYYKLATPTDTPITGTLLDDLNAFDQATSYQGNTYITVSSVSPDLPATLSVAVEQESALPVATETSVGMVSVGDGLSITDGGVLSVNPSKKEVYSTEEQVVGTWIDGKPVYRVTLSGKITSTSGTYVPTNAYNATTIDVISCTGKLVNDQNQYMQLGCYLNSSNYSGWFMSASAMTIFFPSAYNKGAYTIVIEYTKKTS